MLSRVCVSILVKVLQVGLMLDRILDAPDVKIALLICMPDRGACEALQRMLPRPVDPLCMLNANMLTQA